MSWTARRIRATNKVFLERRRLLSIPARPKAKPTGPKKFQSRAVSPLFTPQMLRIRRTAISARGPRKITSRRFSLIKAL